MTSLTVTPNPRPRPVPAAPSAARPRVLTPLPGPRSAELLARSGEARVQRPYLPRHFPFAVAEASGTHIRTWTATFFIDFLSGAGVLSLGHNHPELVAAATEQMGVFTHGLTCPPRPRTRSPRPSCRCPPRCGPDEDPVLWPDRGQRGGRGDQAVQDGDRPRRDRVVPGRVPRQQPRRDGPHRERRPEATHRQRHARRELLPLLLVQPLPARPRPADLPDQLRELPGARAARPERRPGAARRRDHGDGAGRRRRDPGPEGVRAAGPGAHAGAGHPPDRRRGADRLRAHRHLVRLRAVRHRARRDRRVQAR